MKWVLVLVTVGIFDDAPVMRVVSWSQQGDYFTKWQCEFDSLMRRETRKPVVVDGEGNLVRHVQMIDCVVVKDANGAAP